MSCFVSNRTVIYEKIYYPLLKWYERQKHRRYYGLVDM